VRRASFSEAEFSSVGVSGGVGFVRCLSASLSWNFELAVALVTTSFSGSVNSGGNAAASSGFERKASSTESMAWATSWGFSPRAFW